MYDSIKSCVSFNGDQSLFFNSHKGVRQGENLSPLLFAIFLNDLESFLLDNNCNGINLTLRYEQITLFLKLFILLYADDTVIFGIDEQSFQRNLDVFYEYTKTWKLNINFQKTKIMIFGTKNDDNFEFKLGDNVISICKEFKYLGVIFSKSRSFYPAMKHNVVQAKKAMHLLYKRIRNINIPIDLQLKLFDQTIVPILLYGCEVWGFQNTQLIENVHNEFLRHILNLRKSTPIYMLHGELGRRPLFINIKNRMISYWMSIVNGKQPKLSYLLYNILYYETNIGNYEHKWIKCIKEILISVGKMGLFDASYINNPKSTKACISRLLNDLYIHHWNNELNKSSKGKTYALFKQTIALEHYLIALPKNVYMQLCKFRTDNHKLPVETGRWDDIAHNERTCTLCNSDVGDKFHYLFACPSFENERKLYLKQYFYRRPNILKFSELISTRNTTRLKMLSKFADCIMKKFS